MWMLLKTSSIEQKKSFMLIPLVEILLFKDFDKILKSVKGALLSIVLQTMSRTTINMPKILVSITNKGKHNF